jgi:hypothetical protein
MSVAVRGGLFAGGNLALFVFTMLTAEYPEGDPDRARQAAKVWAELGGDALEWGESGDDAARAISTNNAGKSIEAFGDFWATYFSPSPPTTGKAAQLAAHCRSMSEACEQYATLIANAQHTYQTLALANYASLLYISTFPWQAGVAYQISQFILRRAQAGILARLLEGAIARTVLAKLMEYSIGSAFYAVGDVAVMDGVKLARGEGAGSAGENVDEIMKEFVASVAFYGAFDAAIKPISKITSNPDVQYFFARMAGGSAGYGPTYGYLNGKRGDDLVPTTKDTTLRTILYTTMAHKPAG